MEEVKKAIEGKTWIYLLGFVPQKALCSGNLSETIKRLTPQGIYEIAEHIGIPYSKEIPVRQVLARILRSDMVSLFETGLNDLYRGITKPEFKTIIGIEDRPIMLAYFGLDDFGGDVAKQVEAITEKFVLIREKYEAGKVEFSPVVALQS